MRGVIRGMCVASVLGLAGMGLAACQRQSTPTAEAPGAPTNAQREAEIAAEQLAALGGPANAEQRGYYEGEFQASGGIGDLGASEGAWELNLLEDYAQFSRPGLGEDGGIVGQRDYRANGMRVAAGPLTITLMRQACTASGVELPYTAYVLFEGVSYSGCARRGIDAGDRPTWASALPELIPAIDACLARASATPARVTFASALEEGKFSVRLREANGARRECITTPGFQVDAYETISDIDRRPGEGDIEFLRGGDEPRASSCRAVTPVTTMAGEQLGWLIRRSC